MSLENNILQPGSGSIPGQNQVGFLFCDHISHDNSNQPITSEITFAKPVKVQQIRIPKGTSQILPKFKPNINTSQTQPESIKSLEIFAKDLENPSSRFETLVSATNLKELYNQDIFYTMPRDIMTTHIIVRGIFRQITLLIYGDVVEEAEAEREDIPLDDLKEDNENLAKSKRQEDEDRMVEPQHISDIYSYFKTVNTLVHTPSISINTDNIRPKLLFEDESGKVRSNNDEIQIIEAYTKELNKVITGSVVVEQTSKYLQHIDQLFIHIDELLKQNDAHIRLPADFNDNVLIYRGIPLSVVRICLKAFSQKYDDLTEVYHGLQLAKSFLNSFDHAYDFIQGDGLEKIYQAILEKEGYVSPYIKVLALEVINMCLSYDFACERFVNLDITKLESFADQGQPATATKEKEKDKERDKEKEKEKDKERTKEREKDRDESKERKHGKSKSKQHSGSKSRSRSKSSKKSKKRKHKDRKSKKDRSRSPTRSPSKSKKKSSKHKKKRESESPSESRSPSRTRKESKPKEIPTIDLKINVNEFEYIFLLYEQQTGYQKILNQLNKSEVTKVNYSIRQVLHKAGLYCYLSDLSKTVEKDLLPEIDRLKRLEGEEQGRSFKEYNSRITHLNEIIDSISTSLRNFLPIFVSQLLCNGRMVTGELKFEECVAKPFLKEKLQGIGIMTHLVTILKHDHYVVSHDMSVLFKRMNFLPSLALCMASDYVINSPHFEDLFMNIRKIFVTLLGAKGGVCFLAKNPQDIKLILNILDYLQRDLKELEAQFPQEVKAFHEDNMAGLFDYCEDFEMNILNSIKDTLKGKHFSEKKVRLGILARQLSSTLKYIIHAINALDIICVKHMAEDYNEILLLNLTSIAHIVNKNRVSNQALKSLMVNDFVMQLLISIMASKNAEEVANKSAEITLAAEIIYQIFRRDTGELPLLWGEALNKVVPPIAKILKDEKNQSYFKDEPELKASITLLENYMEPIYTYSILNEKDDGVMLLLIEFNKKCRYQGPPKLGIQQKHSSAQKHDHDGLPPMLSESISLRDDIKYFGNSSTPNSPIIYMESALNILNIMASYYHNILIHYLEKDIFAGVSMITNSLCLIIEKILTPDTLSSYTHKILNLRNSYVNTYLCTLTKALYLIYQRMEYRLGSEENSYENMDLLQALLNLHAACFNYCHGNAGSIKQTNITKQYLVLTSELIVSILTIWSEFSAFTEVFIYELCYRYFTTVKNRSATLFLLSTILRSLHQNDKTLFSTAIRTLVSPYKSRKYERKLDNKERDRDASMPKERKPLPIFKVHHHDEFFEEHLRQETPLFELFVESFVEAKSPVFEVALERFLEVIFLRTEFKYQKELMSIFERKWKSFYENRQESLGEDTFKMRSLGMMVQILAKISKSDEFKTYLIDKKVTSDLIRILQIIEDEFYSHTMFKRLTSARRILLLQIKESIYDIFINLCNHDIGVVKPDTTSQEYGHLLENIPSISEIQDLLKTIVHELTTVDKLTERINKMREEGAQQANGEMSDESQEIDDEGLKASLRGLIKAFNIIENLGRNVVGQYILLNTEYSKIIRNPSPIIYFNDFYASLIHLASLLSFTKEEEVYNVLVLRIMQNFLHCVYLLCYNPLTNQILNSEKRKTSLKALLLKNKSIKVPNMSGQASTVVESLESLSAILIEKKRALYEHRLDYSDQLEHYHEITSSIDVMLFETICLANYFNLNPDHKKDNEKIYIDMDHPKEIEQKFKDAEEKEAAKELSQTLLDIRAATNSNHKLSTQAMILLDYSLDDLMAKPNQPLLAWKKGRFHNVAREQWGLFENRISGFKYSHLNDVEVEHWDYDGCVTFNKRKLEAARKKELINKDGPYKRSEHVRNHLFLLFETNSLFNNQPKENIFTNKITYTLECPEQATARLDEKPLTASKEKQFERKPKQQISSENYYTLAQLTSQQDSYIKQQQQQQQPNLATRQLSNQKSNSRPSSMHVDQFTSKQHSDKSVSDAPQTVTTPTSAQQKGITGGPSIQTPSRSMSLEPQMSPINREDSSKELIRTSSSTSMQGPSSFIPQEFPTAQAGGAPMGQPLIGTQSSPQGDMLPYQRPGAINTQQSIPGSIKVGGGPINMGPGSGQNMPGPGQFSQGAPLNQVGYMPNIQGGMPGGMGPMNPGMNVPMGQQQMMGMPMNPNMQNNMYPNRMQQQGGRMHPGGPGGPGGFNTSPGSNRQQQSHGGDMRDLRDIRGMIRSSMDSANNPNQRRENHDNDMMMPEGQHHPFPHGGMMHQQMGGPHMGPMGPVDQQQQQNFPHGGPMQGQGPQPGLVQGPQGGVPTRVDEMNPEERTLMQEIMALRQRNDPRCTQRIKEILKHNPRILAFIKNQNRGQPGSGGPGGPSGPGGPGGQNPRP